MSADMSESVLSAPQSLVYEWNFVEDFLTVPNQLNPNPDAYGNSNVWYFLRSTGQSHNPATYDLLSQYDPDDPFFIDSFGVHNVQGWIDNGDLPGVVVNRSGVDIYQDDGYSIWDFPNETINIHPTYGQDVIVGWKAPFTGIFDVEGFFRDINHTYVWGDGVYYSIDKESQTLVSGGIGETFSSNIANFNLQDLSMNQGEFLYFIVNINGGNPCDSTELSLSITTEASPLNILSINDISITEGDADVKNASFTVNLSAPSDQVVTVQYDTADGTTETTQWFEYNGHKYALTEQAKTWEEAQLEAQQHGGNLVTINNATEEQWLQSTFGTSQELWIGLTDKFDEGNFVWISGEPVTYTNWHSSQPDNFNNENYSVMNFSYDKKWNDWFSSYSSYGVIEVINAPIDDSQATAGTDYTPKSGTLTFNPGETTKTISIPILGDTVVESDETFFVNLSNPTNAVITNNQGIGAIVNDDNYSQHILSAEADTYVRNDMSIIANDNEGLNSHLIVGTGRSGEPDRMRALMRFNLSDFSGTSVESAVLRLTVKNYAGYGVPRSNALHNIEVHRIVESGNRTPWIEGNGFLPNSSESSAPMAGAQWPDDAFGVAWFGASENSDPNANNNLSQPDIDPTVVATAQFLENLTPSGSIIEWDITSLVNDWLSGAVPNYGITLVESSPGYGGQWEAVEFESRENEIYANVNPSDSFNGLPGPKLVLSLSDITPQMGTPGDDTLKGTTGADTMIGLTGNDTYTVNHLGDKVIEHPDEGTDAVKASVSYSLPNHVENLTLLGTGNLDGAGNALANKLTGNNGDNVLLSGAGNDTLDGKAGNDRLQGETGDDTYLYRHPGSVIVENLNEGTDTVKAYFSYGLGANLENLILIGAEDWHGIGNSLDNKLTGNSADNLLNGGPGADVLTGKAGADVFIFNFGQSLVTAPDRIKDFALGEDKIDLLTQGGGNVNAPVSFTRAADSKAATLTEAMTQVFTDADGALAGNQALGINSAALVKVLTADIRGTYLMVNNSNALFQADKDLLINIRGYTGSLPDFGAVPVDSFFV